jgi:hypothetical protein
MQRLSLILSTVALVVALLGASPVGQAARKLASVPFAKKAAYAANAGAVDGIQASRSARPGRLVPLGPNGKFPVSVEQAGPAGPPGPAGSIGPAGPAGPSGSVAYALVDPNGGAPRLVTSQSQGFSGVTVGPFGQGDYCLSPNPGVDVTGTAAVAGEEAFLSNAIGVAAVRYPMAGPTCPAGQLEVKTFAADGSGLSGQIAFAVNVP